MTAMMLMTMNATMIRNITKIRMPAIAPIVANQVRSRPSFALIAVKQ